MYVQRIKIANMRGFTLIELAIVLVIVGILVGVGTSMVGVLTSAIKVRQTRDSLDENMQAIASWASANNRLPKLSDFTSNTPVAKTQMDAWTRPFVFLYYSSLAPATATRDTICGRRSTPLTMTTSDPVTTVSNVAYAILSGGDSSAATLKSTLNGTFLGAPFNGAIPRLASSSKAVGGNATGAIAIDPTNNDIVRWVTLDELRSKVGCQGAPLKIVNNELPFGAAPNPYSAVISADGGVPWAGANSYGWCLEFAPRTGLSGFDTVPANAIKPANTCLSAPETTFVQYNTLALQKKAGFGNFSTGSYQVTVYVRDNADGATPASSSATTACNTATLTDNCASKPFVLTINPN